LLLRCIYTSKRQRRDLAGINNIRISAGLL
jgi:hypothetical protein